MTFSQKIRALVVDDEPVARDRVVRLLQQQSDIELVGQCSNGLETVTAIERLLPDLVFLDVQMPEMDGFEVVKALDARHIPAVVFVTAYDEYALRAFEVHALDYLLKPFSSMRFRAALAHARDQLHRRRAGELGRKLLTLAPTLWERPEGSEQPDNVDRADRPNGNRPERLLVRSAGRVHFVRTAEIEWCEAAGNYVRLHVGRESHLFRETMNSLESKLDPRHFVRIHRSTIVNVEQIEELRSSLGGESTVALRNGVALTLSRGYRENFQQRLGKSL
jgi:two-component system, LytTR family, response regulator